MSLKLLTLALLSGATLANPVKRQAGEEICISDIQSSPQCCSVDGLGVVATDCETPAALATIEEFRTSCGDVSKAAKCCALPVAGQALSCSDPAARPPAGA